MKVPFSGRPASWVGAGLVFGAVLLIISPQAPNGQRGTLGFALLALAMVVPSAWWLVCEGLGVRRRYWALVGAASVLIGVVALMLFPASEDTPFGVAFFG
ncbi:hypothetical protein G7Y29_07780 [Corynebacterium qintianiae]|uniref:Uncharacterized protein n=1 Tax=Corynebacterium qintianiae TaxID=2709392 RepID=A0A7T0KLQ3_9CORY|nr:hypothetical protein [Corynebacterium qintianiae]QPK82769.1 hypothetical protein G7Y29_07780 [Corynebacterium qintianiae]